MFFQLTEDNKSGEMDFLRLIVALVFSCVKQLNIV